MDKFDFGSYLQIGEDTGAYKFTSSWSVTVYNVYFIIFGVLGYGISLLLVKGLCQERGYHRNLKVTFCVFICSFLISSTSALVQASVIILELSKDEYRSVYWSTYFFMTFGPNLCRISFAVFIVERTVATKYADTYENNKNIFLPLVIVFLAFFVPTFYGFNYFVFGVAVSIQVTIMYVVDGINLIALGLLYFINKKMRHITIRSNIILARRYQISENIQVLKLLFPLITVGIMFNLAATLAFTIQVTYLPETVIRTNIYYMIPLAYPVTVLLIVLKKDKIARNRIYSMFRKVPDSDGSSSSRHTNEMEILALKNSNGQALVNKDTHQGHFLQLKVMWK